MDAPPVSQIERHREKERERYRERKRGTPALSRKCRRALSFPYSVSQSMDTLPGQSEREREKEGGREKVRKIYIYIYR